MPQGNPLFGKAQLALKQRRFKPSAHTLDLKQTEATVLTSPTPRFDRPVSRRMIWQRILDEQLHLKDVKRPALSYHPRGWRDFPHRDARTVGHAVWLMVSKFFQEHPLADLTILTAVHLSAVVVWNAVTWPVRALDRDSGRAVASRNQAMPAMPVIPLTAIVPEPPLPSLNRPATTSAIRYRTGGVRLTEPAPATNAPGPVIKTARAIAAAVHAKPQPRQWSWQLPFAWPRALATVTVAGLLVATALTAGPNLMRLTGSGLQTTIAAAQSGASRLLLATEAVASGDLNEAQGAFAAAATDFNTAKSRLGNLGLALARAAAYLPIDSTATNAGPLLIVGDELARAGQVLAGAMAALETNTDPLTKVTRLRAGLEAAQPHLDRAAAEIGLVSSDTLTPDVQGPIATAQTELPAAAAGARQAAQALALLQYMLGNDSQRRYLVIFQNNAELRATGGFIGSFAILDLDRGDIERMEIPGGGSYDLQGSLAARLVSPQPLRLIRAGWEFQDANWFADYPASAAKLAWFLEKSGGPSVDGVIALNMRLMEQILEVTGPIKMPEYGKTIDHRNFWYETQKQVELDYDQEENRPKQFIADMAPKLIERLLGADNIQAMRLAAVMSEGLATKDALVWLRNDEREWDALKLGWGGQIKPADGDYLSIVHSNIGGQKTDLKMSDRVDHSVQVMADGSATVTLTLERTHNGTKGALFTGVRNVDYVRFLVPYGSQLIDATGFNAPDPKLFKIPETDRTADSEVAALEGYSRRDERSGLRVGDESGKTAFGGWLQTDPGETMMATLVYRLPPNTVRISESASHLSDAFAELIGGRPTGQLVASYSLLLQKQPGANPIDFTSRLDLPRGFYPAYQSPARDEDDRGRWQTNLLLDRDTVLDAVATAPGQTL